MCNTTKIPVRIHILSIRQDIRVVPILVGGIQKDKEEKFGAVLAPYLEKDDTIFVISSDFCHW